MKPRKDYFFLLSAAKVPIAIHAAINTIHMEMPSASPVFTEVIFSTLADLSAPPAGVGVEAGVVGVIAEPPAISKFATHSPSLKIMESVCLPVFSVERYSFFNVTIVEPDPAV